MNRLLIVLLAGLLFIPSAVLAATPTIEELQKQIAEMAQELDEISGRVDVTERHTFTDKISFYGDIRTKADTLHYQDVTWNPGIKVDFTDFFNKAAVWQTDNPAGSQAALTSLFTNLATNDPGAFTMLNNMMAAYMADPVNNAPGVGNFRLATAPRTSDINNDILYTTRLRLGMKAEIADNMNFSGRLLMYKNWGDSTGSKVFDSWNAYTMDGTDSGNTTGDWLRVERAFFNWKDIGGSNFYFSIGRRPSTYGPPSNYRENELRGGTPNGQLVHFNFDGITIGYHLGRVTGVPGQALRFCYGQGYESEWGNGELFNEMSNLEDTHLGGFMLDAYNDGQTSVYAVLFRAQDVVDGFKGVIAFPTQYAALFAPTLYSDMQKFPNFNFVTRVRPTTVIGDINLGGVSFSREEDNGFVWFGSASWTQLEPNGKAGMFGGLGTDAVYQATLSSDNSEIYMTPVRAEDDKTQNGYGVYVGIRTPAPLGKFGIEYNYGSKYWTPFTQAQDDMIGSKLATRGHVGEAYYIFDINPNAFIKIGGIYYDYEYTNSGSPVGKPLKVDAVKDGRAYSLLPVVDKAWDGYVQITMRF